MIDKIGQIAVAVTDVPRAIRFYCDILSLEFLFEASPNLAFVRCGDIRLMLTTLQGEVCDHHTSVIYYQVKDIEATTVMLKSRGIVFEREPQLAAKMPDHDLWLGFLRDPDNNLIGIMAEITTES
ncbi:VOC family protein [Litorilituus lipolyticus]|uniref:VOC family protein n=1 Tax=Litorilituus lipolyticus TaxID=2491017 RepID=A0A502KU22_9GAMM|nr:VOC family protein [Litorilituus lipolyticus]TPH13591.1 VOC family protein [Litorilituus lipolyticus]